MTSRVWWTGPKPDQTGPNRIQILVPAASDVPSPHQDASLCGSVADSTVDNLGDAALQSDATAASSCLPNDHYVCCYCSTLPLHVVVIG
ncbi:unnamed protein product [Boreogadus saida]